MWTELDPVANRVSIMNLSLEDARALVFSLQNAAHYKRKLGLQPNPAMESLKDQLELSLYGAAKEGPQPIIVPLKTPTA